MMRGNLGFDFICTMASMMLGWSEPRLTKQWVMPASQIASKKAKEAVYMLLGSAAMADDVEAFLLGKIAEGVLRLVVCGVRGAEAEAGTVRREDDMLGVELEERLLMRAADTEPRPRPEGLDGLVGRHLQRAEGANAERWSGAMCEDVRRCAVCRLY